MAERTDWYYCPKCHEQGWVYHGEIPDDIPDSKGGCPENNMGNHRWKKDKMYQNINYTNFEAHPAERDYLCNE